MRIIDLIKNTRKPFFSLEFFPPADFGKLGEFFQTVDELAKLKPLFASVTYGAGGSKRLNTLRITSELVKRGLTTMAHMTCVGSSADEVSKFLADLKQNGVDNVLALRGDKPKDEEWKQETAFFKYAVDLVRFIKKSQPDMGIAVAAYPAPHPESVTFESDRLHTAEKVMAGADFGITQLFFDNREYISLVSELEKKGIKIPIVPGIMPVQSFSGLRKILSLCGATIPAKFYLELEEANARGFEAIREVGIKFALDQIRGLLDFGVPGIHLYTLNKSDICKHLIREIGL